MATFDAHKNFAVSTVAVAPSSPTGGTSLSVFAGDGTKFPAVPFNAVIWPVNTQPVAANAEIVRVTNISGDVFTITRNAEVGGTTRSVIVGDQIGDNITAKLFTDIESLFPVGAVVGTTDAQVLTNKTLTAPAISAPVLSGTATGTYTLAGTPTITAPTITTPTISSPVLSGTATGTYTLSGSPTINAHVVSGDITGTYALKGTPTVWNVISTTATGTQDNFAPGLIGNTLIRANNATLLTITGFTGGYDGQVVRIISIGAGQVDFVPQLAGTTSLAANRLINFATVGNTSLGAGVGYAEYQYDVTTARWRLINHEQGLWITRTFAAGNYTAGVGTWVVASASRDAYYLRGRTLGFSVAASGTTNNGTNTVGKILVPGGYSSVAGDVGNVYVAGNGSGGSEGGFWQSSANQILTARYGVAAIAAGTWSIFASGQFEIQ